VIRILLVGILCAVAPLARADYLWAWHGFLNDFTGSFEVPDAEMQPGVDFGSISPLFLTRFPSPAPLKTSERGSIPQNRISFARPANSASHRQVLKGCRGGGKGRTRKQSVNRVGTALANAAASTNYVIY
jgi:hypothetical protein